MVKPISNFVSLSTSELTEAAYEKLADETLDALTDYFEDLTDEAFTGADYDVVFSVSHSMFCSLTLWNIWLHYMAFFTH